MKSRTVYEVAGEASRTIIRRVSFFVCLAISAAMAVLTAFNVAAGYFKFDFYTVAALFAFSLPAAFLIRSGKVTVGALLLIVAIEAIVIADPYPLLGQPSLLGLFLIGDCLGFIVTALLAALFVGRALVVGLTLAGALNIVVVSVISHSRELQDSSPVIITGLLSAGTLVVLLHSLFLAALSTVQKEERKAAALHEQLMHAQKFEALGRFSGAIAHDFNNMLTAISGRTEVALLESSLPDATRSQLGELKGYIEKAGTLVRQLLLFSRKQQQDGLTVDAGAALRGIEGMLATLVSKGIQLSVKTPEMPIPVHLAAGQFEQVVVNLVVNARDATEDGGRIAVQADLVDAASPVADSQPPLSAGHYAAVAVRDTGMGMDDEVRSHLFEPFYTTKPAGKGTGLGLSTVYAIVTQAGGGISVNSEPGAGSEFVVYLPTVAR